MITTNDDVVADRARLLRSQGESSRYVTQEAGFNYRMTETAAALGMAQMPKIEARNEQRRANARRLNKLLASNERIIPRRASCPGATTCGTSTPSACPQAEKSAMALQAGLRERGIETAVFYPTPIHQQPLYRRLGYGELHLPVAECLAGEALSLPVHPALTPEDIEAVAAAVVELMN